MTAPTEAQLRTQLQDIARIFDNYLSQQTVGADIDTADANVLNDFAAQHRGAMSAIETRAGQVVQQFRGVLEVWAAAFCHHILGDPERTLDPCLDRIFLDWATRTPTPVTILTRGFTFATPAAAAGNVGTGVLRRLTVDEFGRDIEAAFAEAVRVRCVADQNLGATRYQELFEFKGANAPRSDLGYESASGKGSGLVLRDGDATRGVQASDSIVSNAGFYDVGGALNFSGGLYTLIASDVIRSWAVDDVTKITLNRNTVYRSPQGVANPHSLQLDDNVTLTQTFLDANVQLGTGVPYYRAIAVRRQVSCDGTFTMKVGSKTTTQAVSSLTNDRWTLVEPAFDADLWPANFIESSAVVELKLASRTTGTLLITEFIFSSLAQFAGLWYMLQSLGNDAGSGVADWQLDDEYTFTDSLTPDSKIQKMLALVAARYLPHTVAGTPPTISDP